MKKVDFLGLGLVVAVSLGTLAGSVRADEEWVLHFEELFGRNELGKDWAVLNGQFNTVYDAPVGKGTLFAKGEALILRRFGGDVRVEIAASSAEPCDLSILLGANQRGFRDCYFLGFGSDNNTASKMLRANQKVAVSDVVIKPGNQHKIVGEKAGKVVTLSVDGKEIMRFEDPSPLEGPAHEMVGLYFWNPAAVDYVRVYGRKGKEPVKLAALPKTEKNAAPVKPSAAPNSWKNLIVNPSFEKIKIGKWPRFPVSWVPEYSGVGDGVEVIRDPAGAHGGERFLRLSGKGPWMKAHSLGPFVRNVQQGKTYEFRTWARSSGNGPAAIEFHPSQKRFPVTDRWQEFAVTWKAPNTPIYTVGKRRLRLDYTGFFLKAYGGVDIDDVSAWEAGKGVPPELQMPKTRLTRIAPDPHWPSPATAPPYKERIWLEVSELTGKPARNVPVGTFLHEAFGVNSFDFVSQQKIRVADGLTGETVPSSILEMGLEMGIQGNDHVVFLADVPAHARKIYYLYLTDREPLFVKPLDFYLTDREPLPQHARALSTPPEAFRAYDKDAPRLTVENVKIERLGALTIKKDDNRVAVEVTALPDSTVRGRAVSPDGRKELEIGFEKENRGAIREGAFSLGQNPEKGIWRVDLDLGAGLKAGSAFVVDAGIWAGGNLRVIRSNDPPRGGRGTARILAARGESENFQFAIAAERALSQVVLTGSELRQVGGKGRIPAAGWKLERVEEVFVGNIYPSPVLRFVEGRFVNVGNYPDPLLPWRRHDIEAGKQRVCLATLRVPRGIPGGDYSGSITAMSADGTELVLPVELRVYDFDMPERPSFIVMMSGVLQYARVAVDREGKFGNDFRFYHVFDKEAADELAQVIARRWMTPALTGNRFCANAIPWTYDEETQTATLDFSRFDANAEILINKYGVDFISIPKRNAIFTYPSVENWPAAGWGLGPYEKHPGRLVKGLSTEEGLQMLEAYARELGQHLEEKGWLDRVSIYIFDEPTSKDTEEIYNAAQAIRRGHPQLQMWGAGTNSGAWIKYNDFLSAYTGAINRIELKRYHDQGARYLGRYNQTIDILAIPRAIALHGYSEGWDGYYHHETTTGADAWINPEPPTYTNQFTPTYVGGEAYGWNLLAGFIYHWPEDELKEPQPEGKSRAWASSLRLEGFRESVEDAEYFAILERVAEKSPAGSRTRRNHQELKARLKQWLAARGGYIDSKQRFYNYRLDETELTAIRRAVCEAIEETR